MEEGMKGEMDLTTAYKPVAIYYEAADTVEYLRGDVPCVYRRIDGFLTLALDMQKRELVGFRLKGFKNLYLTHLKQTLDKLDVDFIALVSVIERVIEMIGNEIFDEPERKEAYRQAREVARAEGVEISKRELPLAA